MILEKGLSGGLLGVMEETGIGLNSLAVHSWTHLS